MLIQDLPDEVLLNVVGELKKVKDLKTLQLVCHRFHDLARDGRIWRSLCFESSIAGQRHNRATIPKTIPPRSVQVLQAEAAGIQSLQTEIKNKAKEAREQALAKWDPRYEKEPVDWFREYVARQAPVTLRWAKTSNRRIEDEVNGIALFGDSQGGKRAFLRLENGHVGFWDIGSSLLSPGKVQRSSSKVLSDGFSAVTDDGIAADYSAMPLSRFTECISIDGAHCKAYVAVDCQLNEIDLHTLQQISCVALPRPISALSNFASGSSSPLIIGTSSGLYRHDPRQSSQWFDDSLQQPYFAEGRYRPLSIVQASSTSKDSDTLPEIYAAGGLSPILVYDQRTFPKVRQSVMSGASISSLSLVPQLLRQFGGGASPFPSSSSSSAFSSSDPTTTTTRGHTLIAGGAKNGKGSLELYGIERGSGAVAGEVRNRTQASRAKLLSVASHGKRLVASDADGNVKWFERDAFSLVRQVNTNDLTRAMADGRKSASSSLSSSPSSPSSANGLANGSGGIFGSRQDNGDVVQKLLPTSCREDADLLLWAGSRVGLLSTSRETGADPGDEHEELDEDTAKAREYGEYMRRALEAQAMEARRMQDFGIQD